MGQPQFDGHLDDPDKDQKRLGTLLDRVRARMADGRWHTLTELAQACGGSEASVSARIRDFRKERFGGLVVNRRPVGQRGSGLYAYQLLIPPPVPQQGDLF